MNAPTKVERTVFRLHWLDGSFNDVPGETISGAMNAAGFGQGALAVLDYWEALPPRATPAETP